MIKDGSWGTPLNSPLPDRFEHSDINSVIANFLKAKTSVYKTRNVLVAQDLQADLPPVLMDVRQIQQLLVRLLRDAELNSGGSSGAHIRIRSAAQDDRVRILICFSSDTKVEERMEARLNLEFSAEIVSRYGGRLSRWRNAEGRSTLTMELPAADVEEASTNHEFRGLNGSQSSESGAVLSRSDYAT